MLQLNFKRLQICIVFLFLLSGCGEVERFGDRFDGGNDNNSSSRVSIVPTNDVRTGVVSTGDAPTGDAPTGDGTALVTWTPPTENTDNSTLTDLAGFKIYYGTFPGEYDVTITIDNPGLSSYLVENLASSDLFFVMTAVNSAGIESAYSEEVYKKIK